MAKLSLDEYLAALEKMKKSRRDRVGILGEMGVTGLGAAVGWLAAVILGAKTVTLFGIGITLAATPVGWLIGVALLSGLAAYGLAKLVRSGGKFDTLKDLNIQELEQRIAELHARATRDGRREPKIVKLISTVQLLVANGRMLQDTATAFIAAVEKGHLSIDDAFRQAEDLAREQSQSGPSAIIAEPERRLGRRVRWSRVPKWLQRRWN